MGAHRVEELRLRLADVPEGEVDEVVANPAPGSARSSSPA